MSNEVNSELDDYHDKYSLYNTKQKKSRVFKCEDCGQPFNSEKQLMKHYEHCEEW